MGKAIIRMQKLKSPVAVRRSMKHAFREQDTPNADPERTPDNTHIGAQNTAEAMQRFNDALPDKVRKNAVIAVEYLITGSPETMHGKSRQDQDAYFADALQWLRDKHGAENVLYAGIHRDETTPHMYAYVMPKDEHGKLNCRAFFGEKDALSKMQTDFAQTVGQQHGLERGLKGSKARHTNIREYYARVNAQNTPKTPGIDVPEPKMLEAKGDYGKRVAESVLQQIGPELLTTRAKAAERDTAVKKADEMAAVAKQARSEAAQNREETDKYRGLSQSLASILNLFTKEEREERIQQANERQEMQRQAAKAAQKEPEPVQKPPEKPKERDIER